MMVTWLHSQKTVEQWAEQSDRKPIGWCGPKTGRKILGRFWFDIN